MDDFLTLKAHVAKYIRLTQEEEDYFLSLLKLTRARKKQLIVQPGFVCKYRNYVVKGAMRAYYVDMNGQDHTISFGFEDWWISDFNSFIFQQPATLFLEAMEDSLVIQLDYQSEQTLMEKVPGFERVFRITAQRGLAFLQRRMLSNLSMSAEERYEQFVQQYPDIVNRIPQYALASYLGFSTEFLSKIRNKRIKKS